MQPSWRNRHRREIRSRERCSSGLHREPPLPHRIEAVGRGSPVWKRGAELSRGTNSLCEHPKGRPEVKQKYDTRSSQNVSRRGAEAAEFSEWVHFRLLSSATSSANSALQTVQVSVSRENSRTQQKSSVVGNPLYPDGVIHHSPGSRRRSAPWETGRRRPNPEGVVHPGQLCRTPSGFVSAWRVDPGCATCGLDPGL